MNQFCCGCNLTFGVKLILLLNLCQNLFYIATATSNIILRIPSFGFNTNLATQTFNAAFCLLGLPFIFAAAWGVIHKLESHVRLYLVYMTLSFALDMVYIGVFIGYEDSCASLPTVLQRHGSAFACGFMRIVSLGGVLLLTVVEMYFIFTVWSLCEDLKAGGGGQGLPELLLGRTKDTHHRYAAKSDVLEASQYRSGGPGGGFPIAYGAVATPGIGNNQRIFNGHYHETNFPPIAKFA